MENEIWKSVNGHPRFEISNLGNLKCDGGLRTPYPMKKGYLISFVDGRKFIHRLVAIEFVNNPNPKEYDQVNHINGIKSDNRAVNLEWCNNAMNVQHAFKTGLMKGLQGEDNAACTVSVEKSMAIIRIMATSTLKNREASKIFGIPYSTLRKIKDGTTWHSLNSYRNKFI